MTLKEENDKIKDAIVSEVEHRKDMLKLEWHIEKLKDEIGELLGIYDVPNAVATYIVAAEDVLYSARHTLLELEDK